MTDWTRRLQPASFNGVRFHVETGEVEAGHRVSTTTIPNGAHVLESFGPAARKYEVDAYLTGATCSAQAEALLDAAEQRHRGMLVLPDAGARLVRLTKARRTFEKDRLGYIAVSIEAVAEPATAGQRMSANALEALVYQIAASVAGAFGAFSQGAFLMAGQPAPVVEAALDAAAAPLGDLVALAATMRLDPAALAAVAGPTNQATQALAGFDRDPVAYGTALAQVAIALADVADPALLAETVQAAGAPKPPPSPHVSRGSALNVAENAGHGLTLVASARALVLGEATARRIFRDRREAILARALIVAVFDDALSRLGRPGLDLARSLAALKGALAELISRREADIAPLITVSASRSLPSLVWAHALYRDPTRADDLAARASAYHPSFMPERFEALAS